MNVFLKACSAAFYTFVGCSIIAVIELCVLGEQRVPMISFSVFGGVGLICVVSLAFDLIADRSRRAEKETPIRG